MICTPLYSLRKNIRNEISECIGASFQEISFSERKVKNVGEHLERTKEVNICLLITKTKQYATYRVSWKTSICSPVCHGLEEVSSRLLQGATLTVGRLERESGDENPASLCLSSLSAFSIVNLCFCMLSTSKILNTNKN